MANISVGQRILVGAPEVRLDPSVEEIVRQEARKIGEIIEAHAPQMFIEGTMDRPAKVVVVVVDAVQGMSRGVELFMKRLSAQLSAKEHVDVLPVATSNPIVGPVRQSNTEIFRRNPR
jgi:hypothetical protein